MIDGPAGAAPKPATEPAPAKPADPGKKDAALESIAKAREDLDEAVRYRNEDDGDGLVKKFLQRSKRRIADAMSDLK